MTIVRTLVIRDLPVFPDWDIKLRTAGNDVFNPSKGRTADAFVQITEEFTNSPAGKVRVGIASIFSYLHHPRDWVVTDLREFLRLAKETDTPAVVQLDGQQWRGNRLDLWNWWDMNKLGLSLANRINVEWTIWSSVRDNRAALEAIHRVTQSDP